VRRGEIFQTDRKLPERGNKPGYYVVVSRDFVAENADISTVVCAPVYSVILGVSTEVVIGTSAGVSRASSIRCDFLSLMMKSDLRKYIGSLSSEEMDSLDVALGLAVGIARIS
jgi:mRNA-degrading endonuclease toxin of MazEF toxin-antitoxin module